MSEVEMVEEIGPGVPRAGATTYPALPNLVWDFAHGIMHSIAPIDEDCTLLRKTIRSSGQGKTLKLKSYNPSIFSGIRAVSGVTDQEFCEEWDPTVVAQNVAAKGAGKSGALFVMSTTRKYLLKTLRKEEKDTLKAMSSDLLQHFTDHPGSFLSRQYALCKVEAQGEARYFVIFNNLFSAPERAPSVKFDLKGARVNRKSKASDLANPNHVRMDLDETRTFPIHTDIRKQVLDQVNLDSDLLAKHNVMDYSMLVGVVVKEAAVEELNGNSKESKKKKKKKRVDVEEAQASPPRVKFESLWQEGLPSALNPTEHFMFGIIDILQDYNTFKKSAHLLKVVVYRTSAGLSTIDAKSYGKRFKDYMDAAVFVEPAQDGSL